LGNLLNGKMRTPKINQLNKFNKFLDNETDFSFLNKSPLNSNAWLSDFLEADYNYTVVYEYNSDGNIVKI